ncbi:MAG: phenylalanine--tRNA ligase subunit alpha, partial [Oxalobacteraceae bacterium]
MSEDIETMQGHMLTAIEAAAGLDALEACRIEALGKQGRITQLLKTLGGMTPEERQVEGPRIHTLREAVTNAIAARKAMLEQVALDAQLA